PAGTEDNVGTGSALVPTKVGARTTDKLTVEEHQQVTWAIDWMSPLADDAVRAYLADSHADGAVAAQLRAAWEFRKLLVRASEERQKLSTQDADLRRATEETRAN